jgi:hypothetical protein
MSAADVPWHYAPVWLSLTTPVAYQLAALLGVGAMVAGLGRRPHAPGRYYFSTYRTTPGTYADTVGREVLALRPDGVTILSLFRAGPASSVRGRW